MFHAWNEGCINIFQTNWIEETEQYPGQNFQRGKHYVVFNPLKDSAKEFLTYVQKEGRPTNG